MLRNFLLISALACVFASIIVGQAGGPENLQFERGELGQPPAGWRLTTMGYAVRLTPEGVSSAKRSVELESGQLPSPSAFGIFRQTFDAGAYKGKRVRFRAAVRVEGETARDQAQLFLSVDRGGLGFSFIDNMDDRPIRTRNWQYFEVIGNIESDMQRIDIGIMLRQKGRVWISDASFDVLGDAPQSIIEPARPITSRGLRNETAFAKLFGYVRYFHPSDEAVRADWDALAIRGARAVESANDDEELAEALMMLFQPISPTLRIVGAGQQYVRPAELDAAGRAKYTYWKHFGVGTGLPSSYHSDRIQSAAAAAPESVLPNSPLKADLGNGLTAWIPLSLYVDEQGTLPRNAAASTAGPAEGVRPTWSAVDRGTRMANVIIAWNVFQHFYPYFDVVGTDWAAELPKVLQTAAMDPSEEAFAETLKRLVAALHDGHGSVSKPVGRDGILPLQWDWVESSLIVTAVGSRAAGSLSIGDIVLKIDGRAPSDALVAREGSLSGATPQRIRYLALLALLTGTAGTTVNLEVERAREPGKSVLIPIQYAPGAFPEERRPDPIAEIESGIYYIDIARISEAEFRRVLPQLEKARGIVFDFRGYPSLGPAFLTHLSDTAMASPPGQTQSALFPDRQNLQFVREMGWTLQPTAPFLTAKKAFIVDARAISYAETCLGIIENYKLGTIVGGSSAGTNGNVNSFSLPGGYQIRWTGMKVFKHDGSQFHGIGIAPTVRVSRTRAGIAAGRDEFLERALLAVKN